MSTSVPKGPLAARWRAVTLPEIRAGSVSRVPVEVENAGTVDWRSAGGGIRVAYHWLDDRGNAIVWDGLRTPLPEPVAPGAVLRLDADVRGPLPPGRYRLALDLVSEGRLWFGEVGNALWETDVEVAPRIERRLAARGGDATALAAQEEPLVAEDEAEAIAYLAPGAAPLPDWSRRVLDAHQEGYGLVGGSIHAGRSRRLDRRGAALAPWVPAGGRSPNFPHPLLCPSAVRGFEPDWTDAVAGLPAARPPADRWFGEPWLYDARIGIRLGA